MLKKLPIGIQTFSEIREENYVYVDKTKEAYDLIKNYKYAFLSRPRRFGKSLFLDTLHNIFEGRKEYFEGLYIYDRWDWWDRYPVIKFAFGGSRSAKELIMGIFSNLKDNERRLGVECGMEEDYAICFKELIYQVYTKYKKKVVILIDEYDKPILDNLDQLEVAYENREILKRLYMEIKNSDQYIRFTFLTGVSKFSKASIFSGLNMLEDITLNPEFGNICGYTQRDIERTFGEYMEGVDLEEVREWYNGYNFLKDMLYNPFDILQFIKNRYVYDHYWFTSGNPSFLFKILEGRGYFFPELSNLVVEKRILDSFDIERMDVEVILFQSGYLTIRGEERTALNTIQYRLYFPNREVLESFHDYVIRYFTEEKNPSKHRVMMYVSLRDGDVEGFVRAVNGLYSSIGYKVYRRNEISRYVGFYVSLLYAYMQGMGCEVRVEEETNRGRIDMVLEVGGKVYILEFKVDGGRGESMKQIKEKRYEERYRGSGKEIYIMGIEFDSKEKNIVHYEWEKVEG